MENKSFIIQIPEPCHEDWNRMTPDDKGRFCGSCSKSVFDFTNKTDAEIGKILMENKGQKLCGHFSKSQLNRPLRLQVDLSQLPKQISVVRAFALAVFLVFGSMLVSCYDHNGQKIGKILMTGQPVITEQVMGEAITEVNRQVVKPDSTEETGSRGVLMGDVAYEEGTVDGDVSYCEIPLKGEVEVHEDPIDEYIVGKMAIDPGQSDSTAAGIVKVPAKDTLNDTTVPKRPNFLGGLIAVHTESRSGENGEIASFGVHETVDVIKPEVISNFEVFPNPASDDFTIKYDIRSRTNIKIAVYDAGGSLVKNIVNVNGQYDGKYQIPVTSEGWASGLYIVKLECEGKLLSKTVIVSK